MHGSRLKPLSQHALKRIELSVRVVALEEPFAQLGSPLLPPQPLQRRVGVAHLVCGRS